MYEVARKELESSLSIIIDVLNLGERSDTSSATFQFTKTGLVLHAENSIASYSRDVVCEAKKATPGKVALVPDTLKGYCRGKETLILVPSANGCTVKAKPNFKADLYAIGEPSVVKREELKGGTKVSAVAESALKALTIVGSFKNRTDKTALNGFLTWDKKGSNLVLADSHHAVSVHIEEELKSSGELKLPLNILSLVLKVRGSFEQQENTIVAASETEYVAVQSLPVKEDRADVESLLAEKPKTRFIGSLAEFKTVTEAIFGGLEEAAGISLDFNEKGMSISAESASSKVQDRVAGKVSGKARTVAVSLHHLQDCLASQVSDKVVFEIRSNVLFISSSTDTVKVNSFAALRG